jgi:FixJ family two-component response regulator
VPSFDGLVAIVDDDPSVQRALKRLLSALGIRSETHASGLAFLESRALHDVDCLILDLHLPGMTGSEVMEEVRVVASKLPVVLMTGRYEVDFAERAFAVGASAFLIKPFSEEELLDAIIAATGHRDTR